MSCECEGNSIKSDDVALESSSIASLRLRNVAKYWAALSFCRIEKAIRSERWISGLWEEDVPRRFKKKHASCADYVKSLTSKKAKNVAADLTEFHWACESYLVDVKGALEAAEKALEIDPEYDEANLHLARAVFRMENPLMVKGEDRKTISATTHVTKYLKQLDTAETNSDLHQTVSNMGEGCKHGFCCCCHFCRVSLLFPR